MQHALRWGGQALAPGSRPSRRRPACATNSRATCAAQAAGPAPAPVSPEPTKHEGIVINTASLDKARAQPSWRPAPTAWATDTATARQPAPNAAARRRPTTAPQVPAGLRPALQATVRAYQSLLGGRLLGVYLRGSAPQGAFVPGLSDLDTFALYAPEVEAREGSGAGGGAERSAGAADGGAEAELAAALRSEAARLRELCPDCTKVELRALPAPAALRALHSSRAAADDSLWDGLGLGLLESVPLAFELKAEAVTLAGLDLPRLLPDAAAAPAARALPSIAEDVEGAARAAGRHLATVQALARDPEEAAAAAGAPPGRPRGSLQHELRAAVRAARWALKRCLRAALELAGVEARLHSRDLYWCAALAPRLLPALAVPLRVPGAGGPSSGGRAGRPGGQAAPVERPLQRALELYLELADAAAANLPGGAGGMPGDTAAHTWRAAAAAEEGAALAAALAGRLDGLFLAQMLTPDPGWLPAPTLPPAPSAAGTKRAAAGAAAPAPLSWAQRLRVAAWAATAGDLEAGVESADPPALSPSVRIVGAVRELDCRAPCDSPAAAAELLRPLVRAPGAAPLAPLLLRGAAARWPAVAGDAWTLRRLAAAGLRGSVRVAPSLAFPFCEPSLLRLLVRLQGLAAAPSVTADMGAAEFAARLQHGNPLRLPRVAYPPAAASREWHSRERYYMQAFLPPSLLAEVDTRLPLLEAVAGSSGAAATLASGHLAGCGGGCAASGAAGEAQGAAQAPARGRSQGERVWVSTQGSVSPLHHDRSNSLLAQVRGRKRMLFWPPTQLHRLYCYPDLHLLRRRSRVNLAAPDHGRFPLFAGAEALEATLGPGDVVFFPGGWAHHTECVGGLSMSLTWRHAAPGCAGASAGGE